MPTRILIGEDLSDMPSSVQYLPEVRRQRMLRRDERTVDDPSKLPERVGGGAVWYTEGINHRVENDHIVRDLETNGLFVEVEDNNGICELLKRNPGLDLSYDRYLGELRLQERE